MTGDPCVTIFAGRFGSGKTEAAISYALALARGRVLDTEAGGPAQFWQISDLPAGQEAYRPILIDLDIVTPYFRSRETADALRVKGVDVVAPAAISQHLDTPAITPEILGAIQQVERATIIDVGGDRQGARALGQFSAAISQRGYVMHFVVNPYRPFTDSLEGLAVSIAEIEASSRLHVASLVSNPNLMGETTAEQILAGHHQIEEMAHEVCLPIAFVCVEGRWAHLLSSGQISQPGLLLNRMMLHHWEERPVTDPRLRLPRG